MKEIIAVHGKKVSSHVTVTVVSVILAFCATLGSASAQTPTIVDPLPTPKSANIEIPAVQRSKPAGLRATGPLTITAIEMPPIPPALYCGPRLRTCVCTQARLRYVFPVQPPDLVEYAEVHHDYPATDIFAPNRSVFVAVTDGIIDELSYDDYWDPVVDDPSLRSGRYVAIIGDDGVRYHGSHLDEVVSGLTAGDRVVAGQILGYVGNSGNARGISQHLHFGISHPTYAGDWETRRGELPPYPYLQAWTRHEVLTPDLSAIIQK